MQKSNSANIENLMAITYCAENETVVTQPASNLENKGLELNLKESKWSFREHKNIPIGGCSDCYIDKGDIIYLYNQKDPGQVETARWIQDRLTRHHD